MGKIQFNFDLRNIRFFLTPNHVSFHKMFLLLICGAVERNRLANQSYNFMVKLNDKDLILRINTAMTIKLFNKDFIKSASNTDWLRWLA